MPRAPKATNRCKSPAASNFELMHTGDVRIGENGVGVFVASNDAEAKQIVIRLVQDLGAKPTDAGALNNARYIEPAAFLLVQLAYVQGLGPKSASVSYAPDASPRRRILPRFFLRGTALGGRQWQWPLLQWFYDEFERPDVISVGEQCYLANQCPILPEL